MSSSKWRPLHLVFLCVEQYYVHGYRCTRGETTITYRDMNKNYQVLQRDTRVKHDLYLFITVCNVVAMVIWYTILLPDYLHNITYPRWNSAMTISWNAWNLGNWFLIGQETFTVECGTSARVGKLWPPFFLILIHTGIIGAKRLSRDQGWTLQNWVVTDDSYIFPCY